MRVMNQRQAATEKDTPAALAMGFFDGVHIGHRAVVSAAVGYAKEQGLRPAVFTFGGGPKGDGRGRRLMTTAEKEEKLSALAVDTLYAPPFDSFSHLAPEAFFEEMLLGEYNAKALFCGEDFAFGRGRAGNVALLQSLCARHGVHLDVVPTTLYKGLPVSSSRIRECLAKGEMGEVNAMLGSPYEIDFAVHHGRRLGTKLGVPTINQRFPTGVQPPPFGVYITQTLLDGKEWPSATGYGTRPSVDDGEPSCETFIPSYSGDLYGKHIRVRFFKKIAEPKRFSSLEELAEAVRGFAREAQAFFE